MKLRPRYLALPCVMMTCAIGPALAGNVTIIQQVGPGSVEVRQSGKGNSVEIKQSIEKKGSVEKKGSADKPDKVVKKTTTTIVDCNQLPDTSQRVRAQAIIQQQGDSNTVITSQDSQVSAVLLDQEGKNNVYIRDKTGKLHESKVIQNGSVTVECGTQQ